MSEVENFTGTKKDKKYLFLDEMLTRNLIKLDNIETDGKENIRQARKEAIKCIQKCIAVLEAKAESNAGKGQQQQPDEEMKENVETQATEQTTENGEVEMKETTKEQAQGEPQLQTEQPVEVAPQETKPEAEVQEQATNTKDENKSTTDNKEAPVDNKEVTQAPDTRPEDNVTEQPAETTEQKEDASPKTKVVKKRNKSKDNKKDVPNDSNKQEKDDSNKEQKEVDEKSDKIDIMQVDNKGDIKMEKTEQAMEVDGAASQ